MLARYVRPSNLAKSPIPLKLTFEVKTFKFLSFAVDGKAGELIGPHICLFLDFTTATTKKCLDVGLHSQQTDAYRQGRFSREFSALF